jgi:hypothetical protein
MYHSPEDASPSYSLCSVLFCTGRLWRILELHS